MILFGDFEKVGSVLFIWILNGFKCFIFLNKIDKFLIEDFLFFLLLVVMLSDIFKLDINLYIIGVVFDDFFMVLFVLFVFKFLMIFLICLMLFFCCIFVVLFLLGFLWILINVFNFILIFLNFERICLVLVRKFIYLIVYFDLKDVNFINKGIKCFIKIVSLLVFLVFMI